MTIDYNKHTEYTYDPLFSGLARASDSVSGEWTEYKYNPDSGHFTGFRSGVRTVEQFSMSYQQIGVGHFLTTEMPGDKVAEVRFDSTGRPVWFRGKGQLPVFEKTTNEGVVNRRSIFRDGVVSIIFIL